MFKKKRFVTAIIAVTLLAVSLAGCGGKKATQKDVSNEEPKKTFTYWCAMPSGLVSQYQTMGEVTMYKELEKRTGIHIDFIHPTSGQEDEQFNLMVAANELPDFIEYNWSNYPGGVEKAINDNIIIKLNDLMEEHTPNFLKVLQSNQLYDKQSKTDSGIYYGFPAINVGEYRTFGGIMIRKDWLDDLNLPVPETLEDWEITLRAFRDQKGATAPFTGESSLFSISGTAFTFNNIFNVGKGLYIDGDKVKFGPIEPAYKEWIALMNKWYKEGLLDNDYASNNGAAIDAKMTNGTSGACFGYVGGTMGRYLNAAKKLDPNYNLVAAQYPVRNRGDEPHFTEIQYEANNPFLSITSACSDPITAAKWIDYLYSEEGFMLKNFGVEGLTYNMVNGKPVYTDEILKNPSGISIVEAMDRHFRATKPSPGFNQAEDYLLQYYQLEQQKEAIKLWTTYTHNSRKTLMPPVTPKLEEYEELITLKTEIGTYIDEMIFKFIHGIEPMENFDKFVKTLKDINVGRYIQIYQEAYDRYLAR